MLRSASKLPHQITRSPGSCLWFAAWLCARSPVTFHPSQPQIPAISAAGPGDEHPPGPQHHSLWPCLQELNSKKSNLRHRQRGTKKGTPKCVFTFFKTLEMNYFPCAFLRICLLGILKVLLNYCKIQRGGQSPNREIQGRAPCKGS